MISLAGLNPEQRLAAETLEGPVVILAGAGSGKTRTLAYRMAHMVSNLNISPENILGISFTNKAAREMVERVSALLGNRKTKKMNLSTFHSLGVKILREEMEYLGRAKNFTIMDSADQLAVVREVMKAYKSPKEKFELKTILGKISWLKNRGKGPEDFINSSEFDEDDPYHQATYHAYKAYRDKLKFYNAIDFDDILFLTVQLFRAHPQRAAHYSKAFTYILVDEFQDTNPLQLELLLQLTTSHQNLCVVGDDDQSIYAFRGAQIKNILDFEAHFPAAKIIKLEQNYRSTQPILELANKIIEKNTARREKKLWSDKTYGATPLLWVFQDPDHEAESIVDEITKYQMEGHHLGDIALLFRSHNLVAPFEDCLRLNQVPYTVVGGQEFFDKKEVKDLLALLNLIHNPRDEISFRRILNTPPRGIGLATLEIITTKAKQKNIPAYRAMKELAFDQSENNPLPPNRKKALQNLVNIVEKYKEELKGEDFPEKARSLVDEIGYHEYLMKIYDNPKALLRRKNDVEHFLHSLERFRDFHKSEGNLGTYLEKIRLSELRDQQKEREKNATDDDDVRPNEVTLLSLHGSKGLEFNTVYLIGMEEEILPHKKSILEGDGIPEERRLAYVGVTRAREKLIMTRCHERIFYGKKIPRHPSRFLTELNEGLFTTQDRTKFEHLGSKQAVEEHKKNFFDSLIADL